MTKQIQKTGNYNEVYRLDCDHNNMTYPGVTDRKFLIRIKEHE